MSNETQRRPGMLSWVLIGALIGVIFTALDGAILGAVLGGVGVDELGPLGAAGRWAGYFAAAGAVLGGLVGAIGRAMANRLVLTPPGDAEPTPPPVRREPPASAPGPPLAPG